MRRSALLCALMVAFAPFFSYALSLGTSGNFSTDDFQDTNAGAAVASLHFPDFELPPEGLFLTGVIYQAHGTTTAFYSPDQSIVITYTDDSCTTGGIAYMNTATSSFSKQFHDISASSFVNILATTTESIPLSGVHCILAEPVTTGATYFVKEHDYGFLFGAPRNLTADFQVSTVPIAPTNFGGFSTSTPQAVDCYSGAVCSATTTLGTIGQGLCIAMCVTFVPAPHTLTDFTDLYGMIANKPPLGYFALFSDAIQQIATTSSAVAFPNTAMLVILFSGLDAGLAAYIFAKFGSWAYHRIKNFDFHA